ncbi:MAG: glycerol-3-phosphate dehydrogenase/oxidase [Candidatus Binatia bacterium]
MNAPELRRQKLRRLGEERFDLLVIGGGINGAGIAREAALRGLKTALVEKGDFACGTSSKSSKLIHGGFRYLETGDFRLVLEASRERDLLRRRLAPHLVRPLRFFFPVYAGGPVGLWKLRAGLIAYDVLSAFRNIERHRIVGRRAVGGIEPRLESEGLRGGALYFDCFTDDARLVLETILSAEDAGAVTVNYLAVERLEKTAGRVSGAIVRDLDGEGGTIRISALAVVNATGPWLDCIRALDDPATPAVLRPTKGAHLVVPRDRVGNHNAVVLPAVRDRRVLFVIPWEEHTIVGTTDTDYRGTPDAVAAEEEDVAYLLETVNFYFPDAKLRASDVVSTFAGLRPLIAGTESETPSEVSREEEIFESDSGLLSLGGGKLTTYRRVAIKVVNRAVRDLEARHGLRVRQDSGSESRPLPGGDEVALKTAPAAFADVFAALISRYGSRSTKVVELLESSPDLAARLLPERPEVRAEVAFAADTEMALRVEDVLLRRTKVGLRTADEGASVADATARILGGRLGWDAETIERRAAEFLGEVGEVGPRSRRQA